MSNKLNILVGQVSVAGLKPVNQDYIGTSPSQGAFLATKGFAAVLCDGISSSTVSQIASKTAVNSFLSDYYSTSEAWSVRRSAEKVLKATNYWLYAQTKNSEYRFDFNQGYVCTCSALVIKSNTAHIFHIGDSRVYRVLGASLEQLTEDHRQKLSSDVSYLSRALGMDDSLEIDYQAHRVTQGEIFVLASDGLFDFVSASDIASTANERDLDPDTRARKLLDKALSAGSDDNISVLVVEIQSLPQASLSELKSTPLPPAPLLQPGDTLDGLQILRELYVSSRSHVFLAQDVKSGKYVVVKTPSAESRLDAGHTDTILMEDWIARRLNSPHLVKAFQRETAPSCIYAVAEFVEGITLAQWMKDNPNPDIGTVRNIIEQVAKGLQSMHRQEMVHQDLRPENILIDTNGTAIIIDFGATKVAGLNEIYPASDLIPGTAQYSAPEYFVGQSGTHRADIFSLGVIAYQMLTGKLPYGTHVAKSTSTKAQQKLRYVSASALNNNLPAWIDYSLKKALRIEPHKRYQEVSEFIYDLKNPNPASQAKRWVPIAERHPILFWQRLSLGLFVLLLISWIG